MKFIAIICFVIILSVSSIDQYCLIKYVNYDNELNPIGQYLIQQGGIPLFASVKMFGTTIVASLLVIGYNINPFVAIKIMIALATFQLWLLWFMFMSS